MLQKMKKYAAHRRISLSALTENYYKKIVTKNTKSESIFDFLKRIEPGDYPEGYDFKAGYYEQTGK